MNNSYLLIMKRPLLLIILFYWLTVSLLYAQDNQYAEAIKIVDELSQPSDTLYERIKKDIEAGDAVKGRKFFEDLRQANLTRSSPRSELRLLRLESRLLLMEKNAAEAIIKQKMALEICKEQHLVRESARCRLELASMYESLEFPTEALTTYYIAIDSFMSIHDTSSLGITYYQIGNLLFFMKNHENGLESIEKAIQYLKAHNDPAKNDHWFYIMSGYNTAGLFSYSLKEYKRAIEYYRLGEQIAISQNNDFWIGNFRGNMASALSQLGEYEQALEYALIDFEKSKANQIWGSAGAVSTLLADIYLKMGNKTEAAKYMDSAKLYLSKIDTTNNWYKRYWLRALEVEILYYKQTGQKDKQIKALEQFMALKDSLSVESEQKALAKIKAQFDLGQKQNEITILLKNSQIQEEKIGRQRALIYSAILVLILLMTLAVFFFWAYKRKSLNVKLILKQRQEIEDQKEELETQGARLQESFQMVQSVNEQLEEKVRERTEQLQQAFDDLDFFLYRSSHDTRRPISTLLGLEQLLRKGLDSKEDILILDKIHETVLSMDRMLSKLQMVYNLNESEEENTDINLSEFMRECLEKFVLQYQDSSFKIKIQIPEEVTICANLSLIKIIFNNLIENAYCFRLPEPSPRDDLTIKLVEDTTMDIIEFRDSGVGMDPEIIPYIFDIYFRGTELSKGNGLGLYLVKSSLEKMGGSIEVSSQIGVGSIFVIYLPKRA